MAQKQNYNTPQIKRIELDNQISLQLTSNAPDGPGESNLKVPEYFNKDPFKANQA